VANGYGADRANSLINALSPGPPVSNIITGPRLPRASKFNTTPTSFAHGCSSRKARAPSIPNSSPSVSSTMMSPRGGPPALSARTVSSSAATPEPSSAAPAAPATES
jgi:hypothetical protein